MDTLVSAAIDQRKEAAMETTVDRMGLTEAEAALRHRRDGANTLPAPPRPSRVRQFVAQLTHFFAAMLWVAAVLALVAGMPALAVAIVCVVVLNGTFAYVQEFRADRAAERLRDLLPVQARVRRDGRVVAVEAGALVVGDLLVSKPATGCVPMPWCGWRTACPSTSPCSPARLSRSPVTCRLRFWPGPMSSPVRAKQP